MKKIRLTKGYFALVDDEDFERINKFKWHVTTRKLKHSDHLGVRRAIYINGRQYIIPMHKEVLGILSPIIWVDHKDRNGLNNTKANLRVCSISENNANKTKRINASSQYLGVTKCKSGWRADIGKSRANIYLGLFKDERLAALAYNEAAKELHGDFANLNII